jgi:late competence protein required for DNA uptake (superfamily II DNA/RNA helicase)
MGMLLPGPGSVSFSPYDLYQFLRRLREKAVVGVRTCDRCQGYVDLECYSVTQISELEFICRNCGRLYRVRNDKLLIWPPLKREWDENGIKNRNGNGSGKGKVTGKGK